MVLHPPTESLKTRFWVGIGYRDANSVHTGPLADDLAAAPSTAACVHDITFNISVFVHAYRR